MPADVLRPARRLFKVKLSESPSTSARFVDALDVQHAIAGLIAVNPEGGKSARAAAISPQIVAGFVSKLGASPKRGAP
jgi:hypothetical protein